MRMLLKFQVPVEAKPKRRAIDDYVRGVLGRELGEAHGRLDPANGNHDRAARPGFGQRVLHAGAKPAAFDPQPILAGDLRQAARSRPDGRVPRRAIHG